MSQSEEVSPYIVYRRTEPGIECALFEIDSGEEALALFLHAESADAFAGRMGDEWRVFHPERTDLLEILKQSGDAGLVTAALDPGGQTPLRFFDVGKILKNADGQTDLWGDFGNV